MKIFADFNNADEHGRIRLNTKGSISDIENARVKLKPGMEITVTDNDEFETIGTIEFSVEEQIWVAKIDWDKLVRI